MVFYRLFHRSKYDGKTEVSAINLSYKGLRDCIFSAQEDCFKDLENIVNIVAYFIKLKAQMRVY